MKLTAKKPTSYIQLKTIDEITVNAYSKKCLYNIKNHGSKRLIPNQQC